MPTTSIRKAGQKVPSTAKVGPPKRQQPAAAKGFDAVYLFDPAAGFWPLPDDATVLDFAFAIDPEKALHCVGVKVNGKPAPLKTVLAVGDTVEFSTTDDAAPSPAWIAITHSPAKELIAHHLGMPLSAQEFAVYTKASARSLDAGVGSNLLDDDAKRAKAETTRRGDYKQPNREGKKLIGAYIDVAEAELLKAVLKARGTTVQDFFADAVTKAITTDISPAERDRLIEAQVARYRATLRATLKK